MDNSINFFLESNEEELPFNKGCDIKWISDCIRSYQKEIGALNFIFVNESEIIKVNTKFLQHDYPTDIITFNYNEENTISGDIYICPEVVKQNSIEFNETYEKELHRVIIHGVLHLIGYNDTSNTEKKEMRRQEDTCLNIL